MDVAILALIVSVFSLAASVFSLAPDRRHAKGSLLVKVYQSWLSSEEQACRRALYEVREANGNFAALAGDEQDRINHAIASTNMVAHLREQRRVSEEDTMAPMRSAACRGGPRRKRVTRSRCG